MWTRALTLTPVSKREACASMAASTTPASCPSFSVTSCTISCSADTFSGSNTQGHTQPHTGIRQSPGSGASGKPHSSMLPQRRPARLHTTTACKYVSTSNKQAGARTLFLKRLLNSSVLTLHSTSCADGGSAACHDTTPRNIAQCSEEGVFGVWNNLQQQPNFLHGVCLSATWLWALNKHTMQRHKLACAELQPMPGCAAPSTSCHTLSK